uniref:EGF-like and EMI domain containing 1 n=1 Tax=Paramormyrops kingsleyae TaxID=1676925 RepID=A0A3B3R8R4_9TELE
MTSYLVQEYSKPGAYPRKYRAIPGTGCQSNAWHSHNGQFTIYTSSPKHLFLDCGMKPSCPKQTDQQTVPNTSTLSRDVFLTSKSGIYCTVHSINLGFCLTLYGFFCHGPWNGAVEDPCMDQNGGCAQLCSSEEGHTRCSCHLGYSLAADSKSCMAMKCIHPIATLTTYHSHSFYVCVLSVLDIDECSSGQAKCSHRCINTLGSFKCMCSPGFELGINGKHCYRIEMEIVNSCQKNNGGCSDTCQHTAKGPICSCSQDYQLADDNKTCVDFDECETGKACCSHFCKNYPGGYECHCEAGDRLHTDGCNCEAQQKSEFDESDDEDADVRQLPGLLFRQLPELLHYDADSAYEAYEDEEESGDDVWAELTLIMCLDGTFGDDCSLSCENCENGAICAKENNKCDCLPGWTGITCNESESVICENHRAPVADLPILGYFGKNCQSRCNCPRNVHCHRLYGTCLCAPGLYGRFCHLACPSWTYGAGCSKECACVLETSSGCRANNGSCVCKPGYQGTACQSGTLQLMPCDYSHQPVQIPTVLLKCIIAVYFLAA